MSMTKRQEQILALLEENRFLTVERLSALTYTSPSSIRRDLTRLQNECLVKRTHGGAAVPEEQSQAAPLQSRMTKNIIGKKKIAKKAAELLRDGASVMLDGSSTAAFLLPHIARHRDICLFTNSMTTALSAIGYGIQTHCLGGESVNRSAVLGGPTCYRAIERLRPELLFFSSHSLDRRGVITDPTEEENYARQLMLSVAAESVFLCDSEKFDRRALHTLASLDEVSTAVFDEPFPTLKTKCKIL